MKNRILFACVCTFLFNKTQSDFVEYAFAFVGYVITRFGASNPCPKKCGEKKSGGENSEHFHSISLFDAVDCRNDLDYECYSTDATNHLQAQICNRLRFVS